MALENDFTLDQKAFFVLMEALQDGLRLCASLRAALGAHEQIDAFESWLNDTLSRHPEDEMPPKESDLDTSERDDPLSTEDYMDVIRIVKERFNRREYAKCAAACDRALQLFPESVKAFTYRGRCRRSMCDVRGAIEDLTRVQSMDYSETVQKELEELRKKRDDEVCQTPRMPDLRDMMQDSEIMAAAQKLANDPMIMQQMKSVLGNMCQ